MNLFIHRAITCQILLIETFVTIYLFILIFYLSQVEPEPLPSFGSGSGSTQERPVPAGSEVCTASIIAVRACQWKLAYLGYYIQVDQDLNIGNVGQFFKFVMAFLLFICLYHNGGCCCVIYPPLCVVLQRWYLSWSGKKHKFSPQEKEREKGNILKYFTRNKSGLGNPDIKQRKSIGQFPPTRGG